MRKIIFFVIALAALGVMFVPLGLRQPGAPGAVHAGVAKVPELSSMILFGIGIGALAWYLKKRL